MLRLRFPPFPRLAVLALLSLLALLVPDGSRAGTIIVDVGRGPVEVLVPSGYEPGTPAPLVLLLHGYSSSGATLEATLDIAPLAEERGFLYAHPDGTVDLLGNRFWNATDACCDFGATGVDDSAYLDALLDAIALELVVDPDRTFVVGHSNGGFMAYRMACDHAEGIAGIASLAGATFADPSDCSPSLPVRTLQVHGDADAVIAYEGGDLIAAYPGAVTTAETWASYDGCSTTSSARPSLDLDAEIPGAETLVQTWRSGCTADGFHPELWTVQGGGHSPAAGGALAPSVLDFLFGLLFADGFESGDLGAWATR